MLGNKKNNSYLQANKNLCKTQIARSDTKEKTILFWTKFFDREDYEFGLGASPFAPCQERTCNCRTTTNRGLLNQSDAIVFHIRNVILSDLPVYRLPHQRWIFYLLESPEHTPADIVKGLNGLINWTMTYR